MSWSRVKMECPTCRRELPPIEMANDDDEYWNKLTIKNIFICINQT
jgi:hypothetical protein